MQIPNYNYKIRRKGEMHDECAFISHLQFLEVYRKKDCNAILWLLLLLLLLFVIVVVNKTVFNPFVQIWIVR